MSPRRDRSSVANHGKPTVALVMILALILLLCSTVIIPPSRQSIVVVVDAFVVVPHAATTASISSALFTRQSSREGGVGDSRTSSIPMRMSTSPSPSSSASQIQSRILSELREITKCTSLLFTYQTKPINDVTVEDIITLCDEIDNLQTSITNEERQLLVTQINLRERTLRYGRYILLEKLMSKDYDVYVTTASFLSPGRVSRLELPNVQDVPFNEDVAAAAVVEALKSEEDGVPLVADCTLDDMKYDDSPLDKLLLKIFRNLVTKNTGGISSPKDGIEGLLEQGRTYMTQPNQTPEAQHKMVRDTLGGLMTPILPPFYRIFMSGIIPKLGTDLDGKQIGPWFYAPWLTSIVTPPFFKFLVGPSKPNSRKDGMPGGLVVEKCKFLQESGCKGLCLHQCKLPAQEFFKEELGLSLTVSPNFVTQECQWSFGEEPLPPEEDPSFPKGCLAGCESRKAMAGTYANLCN